MTTINIKLLDLLKNDFKMPEAKAREFAEAIQEVAEENVVFKSAVKEDFLKMEIKLEQVNTKIEQSKADMIKWMFLFWVGSVIATLGGLIAIVKFMVAK